MPQSYNEMKYKEAIQKSQEILRKYLVSGSGQTMDNTVNALLGILDDKELVALLRMDKSLYLLQDAAFAHIDTLKDLQINYLKNAVRNLEQTNKLLRDTKPNLPDAIDIVVEALRKDKTPWSYYYGWLRNIAMAIFDEVKTSKLIHFTTETEKDLHDFCNDAAKRFLEILIYKPKFEKWVDEVSERIKEYEQKLVKVPKDFAPGGKVSQVNAGRPAALVENLIAAMSNYKNSKDQQKIKELTEQLQFKTSELEEANKKLAIATDAVWISKEGEKKVNTAAGEKFFNPGENCR